MRVTLSPINNTNFSYGKEKAFNSLTSHPINTLSKDTFTTSFSGGYGTSLVDLLSKRSDHLQTVSLKEIADLVNPKTVNALSENGYSPLYYASWFGAPEEVVSHLIKNGANVNFLTKDGQSALYIAAYRGYKGIVELLLNAGADIKHKNNSGTTPLMEAISNGTSEVAKLLVDSGADIKFANNDGQLPIHLASGKYLGGYNDAGKLIRIKEETSLLNLIETLLKKGSNINARDNEGKTPILNASYNNFNVLKFLIDKGADVSIKDNKGNTALHWAMISNCPRVELFRKIQLLLDKGIDINAKNNDGKTALYLLCHELDANPKTVNFLVKKGAKLPQRGTGFPILGDNANIDHPKKVAQELKEAGLDKLPSFIKADRCWYYWSVNLPEGMFLPRAKAIELNKTMGEDIRAFGYAGGMDEKMLNDWMKNTGGMDSWHVDTKEGLAKLVNVLQEQFGISKKIN